MQIEDIYEVLNKNFEPIGVAVILMCLIEQY